MTGVTKVSHWTLVHSILTRLTTHSSHTTLWKWCFSSYKFVSNHRAYYFTTAGRNGWGWREECRTPRSGCLPWTSGTWPTTAFPDLWHCPCTLECCLRTRPRSAQPSVTRRRWCSRNHWTAERGRERRLKVSLLAAKLYRQQRTVLFMRIIYNCLCHQKGHTKGPDDELLPILPWYEQDHGGPWMCILWSSREQTSPRKEIRPQWRDSSLSSCLWTAKMTAPQKLEEGKCNC